MTEKIAKLILSSANIMQLCAAVQQEKWTSLWESGLEKVKAGQTSYAELIRVLGDAS
jgi:type II secretory ATPase GspE/PulE/Tfp pilus assembly ATPase PilB-like protein